MKTVKFYNKVNGKKTSLISTYENIQNDSDLACVMFKEIGMPNMPESIDFEDLFNNNFGFESDYVIMEFVEIVTIINN